MEAGLAAMLAVLRRNRRGLQVRAGGGARVQGTEDLPHGHQCLPFWVLQHVGQHWAQFLWGPEEGPGFLTIC